MRDSSIVHLGHGAPRGFEVEAIEKDITQLWKSAGKDGTHVVSRACQANLIVPVEGDRDVSDLIEDVTRLQPSRVIVIRLQADRAPGPIHAWVSGTCTREPGEALVCSESITLETGPGNESSLPGAILSLVVGNLPRAILVEGVPLSALGWIPALGRSLDTVLVDAATLGSSDIIELWTRCGLGRHPSYRDLVWTRLLDWRRALAMIFDDGEAAGDLKLIRGVSLELADPRSALPGTALLLGWLASRLGWRVESDRPLRFVSEDGSIEIQVAVVPPSEDPARLRSVTFHFDGLEKRVWRRLSTQRAIEIESASGAVRLNQSKMSRASAIVKELHQHGTDTIAGAAMEIAAGILPGLEASL